MRAERAPAIVRRAAANDVAAILDLLVEYDLPRAYFEPYYLGDPTYRPEHSWIAEQDGQLAAHLRMYSRWIRVHGVALLIAGVGNVITGRAFRGQGYAHDLLRAMTAGAAADGFAYSLLWTHLPSLYERHGWALVDQRAVRASLPVPPTLSARITSFLPDDLPEVARLYEATNVLRTGPTVRSRDYWRAQLAWLREDANSFLIARTSEASLAGYVRGRPRHSDVEILELAVAPTDVTTGRALLGSVARHHGGQVQAWLPPSLLDVVPRAERDMEDDSRFMGRVLDLGALVQALRPVLERRLAAAGVRAGACWLTTSTGAAELRLSEGQLVLHSHPRERTSACLNEAELAHLLFHGYDDTAVELLDGRRDTDILRVLFPAQDFVVWPADKF